MQTKNSSSHLNLRSLVLGLFAVTGLGVSIYQSHHYYSIRSGMAGFKSFCNLSSSLNCDVATLSTYADLTQGLPISSIATGFFAFVLVLALMIRSMDWHKEVAKLGLVLSAAGLLVSLTYLGIMVWALPSLCLFCLIVDFCVIGIFSVFLSFKLLPVEAVPSDESPKTGTLLGIGIACIVVAVVFLKGFDQTPKQGPAVEEYLAQYNNASLIDTTGFSENLVLGDPNGKIKIIEFSDFECPFCRLTALNLHHVLNRFPKGVKIVLKNFPLNAQCNRQVTHSMHQYACEAAKTVICANKQGKLEKVYEGIFENQANFGLNSPKAIALKVPGINAAELETCIGSAETAAALGADIEDGIKIKLSATPTLIVNGKKVEGGYPLPVWLKIIEQELKK